MNYESHITIEDPTDVLEWDTNQIAWKYSIIHGDPILGYGARAYASKNYSPSVPVKSVIEMLDIAVRVLKEKGHKVVRSKVELVLHDHVEDMRKLYEGD